MSIQSLRGQFAPIFASQLINRLTKHHQKHQLKEVSFDDFEKLLIAANVIPCNQNALEQYNKLLDIEAIAPQSALLNQAAFNLYHSVHLLKEELSKDALEIKPLHFACYKNLSLRLNESLSFTDIVKLKLEINTECGQSIINMLGYNEFDFEGDIRSAISNIFDNLIEENARISCDADMFFGQVMADELKEKAAFFADAYRNSLGEISNARALDMYCELCGYPGGYQQLKNYLVSETNEQTTLPEGFNSVANDLLVKLHELEHLMPGCEFVRQSTDDYDKALINLRYQRSAIKSFIREEMSLSRTKTDAVFNLFRIVSSSLFRGVYPGCAFYAYVTNFGIPKSQIRTVMKEEKFAEALYQINHGVKFHQGQIASDLMIKDGLKSIDTEEGEYYNKLAKTFSKTLIMMFDDDYQFTATPLVINDLKGNLLGTFSNALIDLDNHQEEVSNSRWSETLVQLSECFSQSTAFIAFLTQKNISPKLH